MKKTISVYEIEGLSVDAQNLYKFINTLCHCKSESAIDFEGRDSALFCKLYDCTDAEYLKAMDELMGREIVEDKDGWLVLHPCLYIFVEDMEYEE